MTLPKPTAMLLGLPAVAVPKPAESVVVAGTGPGVSTAKGATPIEEVIVVLPEPRSLTAPAAAM